MPFYEVRHNWGSGWCRAPLYGYFPEREDIVRGFLVLFHGCLDSEEWDPAKKVLTLACVSQVMKFTEITETELRERLGECHNVHTAAVGELSTRMGQASAGAAVGGGVAGRYLTTTALTTGSASRSTEGKWQYQTVLCEAVAAEFTE